MRKRLIFISLFLLVAAAAGIAGYLVGSPDKYSQSSNWRIEPEPRAVFSSLGVRDSERPQVAFSTAGTLYLLSAYRDHGVQRLGLALSRDGGDTFSGPVAVSTSGGEISARGENGPSLAQHGMSVYTLWQQVVGDRRQILFSRSRDMGQTFQAPISVTDKIEPSFNGFSSMTVAPNGNIYVVWLDGRKPSRPGTFSIYLARSTDQGATFSPNVQVAEVACPCCRPAVAVSGNDVYVAWRGVFPGEERDIVVAASHDGAQSFADPVRVSQERWVLHACPEAGPALAVVNGELFVAWHSAASKQAKILLTSSRDLGQSFSPARLASNDILDPNHPALSVADDGALVLAFQGRDPHAHAGWGLVQPYVTSIAPDGTLDEPIAIAPSPGSASYPDVAAASSGRAFLAWTQYDGPHSKVILSRARFSKN